MAMSPATRKRFEVEKAAYWSMRDRLLSQYRGKWVAVVGGEVVAVDQQAGAALERARQLSGSNVGFVARVGYENAIRRIRQVSAGRFDGGYDPSIPMVTATVSNVAGDTHANVDFVVDTGSDGTTFQARVADELNLWDFPWGVALVAGISGPAEERDLYAAVVRIAEHDVIIQADCRQDMEEDLLGRDVINEYEVTLSARRGVVRFDLEGTVLFSSAG